MSRLLAISNATKANIIAVVNTLLGLLIAFGVSVTDDQAAAIVGLANALLVLWVGLTYSQSAKRVPDA